MKPVVPRGRADQDVDEAIAYYAKEAPHVVDELIDALEVAYNAISPVGRNRAALGRMTRAAIRDRLKPMMLIYHRTWRLGGWPRSNLGG